MYQLLDLFSGIGGFSLGLERSGAFKTVAFCEIDKKAQKVLRKHWPDVPIFDDVTTLTAGVLNDRGITIDAICGGFPCQDISVAGRGAGIEGERSGLWSEYARLIGELRPRYVFVENVAALLGRGLDRVLGDLAAFGYDAEWHCIPASALGAPHRRDRLWVVAYPNRHGQSQPKGVEQGQRGRFGDGGKELADAASERAQGLWPGWQQELYPYVGEGLSLRLSEGHRSTIWDVEPGVGQVVDGFPGRVDRLKQLGNAVVPQIPELLGKAILQMEAA